MWLMRFRKVTFRFYFCFSRFLCVGHRHTGSTNGQFLSLCCRCKRSKIECLQQQYNVHRFYWQSMRTVDCRLYRYSATGIDENFILLV